MRYNTSLTEDKLKELLRYDPETGTFYWRVGCGKRIKAGTIAGTVQENPNGRKYIKISIGGIRYYANQLAWLYMAGEWPGCEVEYVDSDPLNNEWRNLRKGSNR